MSTQRYLCSDTRQAMLDALTALGLPEVGPGFVDEQRIDVDTIGAIEGADGWHVNVLCDDLPAELAAFEVPPPATPFRVFAE